MTFSGHAPGSREYRRLIVGLFFAGIATFAQLYSAQAVLPQISSDLSVSPATAALSVSAATSVWHWPSSLVGRGRSHRSGAGDGHGRSHGDGAGALRAAER